MQREHLDPPPWLPGDAAPTEDDPAGEEAAAALQSATDTVVALLVTAAAEHDRSGRRALAASLRQHACELLHPAAERDAHLQLVDELLG